MWFCARMLAGTATGPARSSGKYCGAAAPACRSTRFRQRSGSCRRLSYQPAERWCGRMRNIVVTGGSRGLGLGVARQLAAGGDRVIVLARKPNDELTAAIEDAKAAGQGKIQFVPFDLADIEA